VHIALLLTTAATAPVAMLLQNRHITAQRIDRVLKPIIGERQFFGELLHRASDLHHLAGQDFKLLILDIPPLNLPLQRICQSGVKLSAPGRSWVVKNSAPSINVVLTMITDKNDFTGPGSPR